MIYAIKHNNNSSPILCHQIALLTQSTTCFPKADKSPQLRTSDSSHFLPSLSWSEKKKNYFIKTPTVPIFSPFCYYRNRIRVICIYSCSPPICIFDRPFLQDSLPVHDRWKSEPLGLEHFSKLNDFKRIFKWARDV